HHPRHEACCPVPGETTARTGGRVIPLSGVTELATEEPRHTVPKSLPEIFGWAGKCRSRWIALDLIHLLESRRNLEERGVERAFLELGHLRFELRFRLFLRSIRKRVGALRKRYRMQSEPLFGFSCRDEFRFVDRLVPASGMQV